jgi:sugar O-acyltransferase (sialic acid O-acetyltransferase NeuD family)
MNLVRELVIVGAGGLGREIAAVLKSDLTHDFDLVGFVDDHLSTGEMVNGVKVVGDLEWLARQKKHNVVIGVGIPAVRRKMFNRLSKSGQLHFPNIIHSNARLHEREHIDIGIGNIISDACILTTNIKIGDFNLINLNCTIGHDVQIGSFCSIMPGVNISGGARLLNEVYIGTGAKLIKATTLGNQSTIGAGAVVNTNVPERKTFVGIPALEK